MPRKTIATAPKEPKVLPQTAPPPLKISLIDFRKINPAPYNPRKDLKPEDPEYQRIKRSIQQFGLVEPLVWNKRSGNMVGGHQRFKVMREFGWKEMPCVVVDMDSNTEKACNVALNKLTGEWDFAKLKDVLVELEQQNYDFTVTGYEPADVQRMLEWTATGPGGEIDERANAAPAAPKEPVSRPGDIYEMGEHRVLCGDATDPADLARLFGADRAPIMWTDPPYGVDYTGKTKDALKIKNDGKADLGQLLESAFKAADTVLEDGAAIYIAHPPGAQSVTFAQRFMAQGWRLHQTLVWVKNSLVLGHSDYHYRHEPILFGFKSAHDPILFGYKAAEGRRGRGGEGWFADNGQTSVFEIKRPTASKDHPTMKPVELVVAMLKNSSPRKGIVFDPFLGSGTTVIAAEQLQRRCFGLEIDPRYMDVVVRRWEEFTGKKATRRRGPK